MFRVTRVQDASSSTSSSLSSSSSSASAAKLNWVNCLDLESVYFLDSKLLTVGCASSTKNTHFPSFDFLRWSFRREKEWSTATVVLKKREREREDERVTLIREIFKQMRSKLSNNFSFDVSLIFRYILANFFSPTWTFKIFSSTRSLLEVLVKE